MSDSQDFCPHGDEELADPNAKDSNVTSIKD